MVVQSPFSNGFVPGPSWGLPGRSLFGERHASADFEGVLPQHDPAQARCCVAVSNSWQLRLRFVGLWMMKNIWIMETMADYG